MRGEELIWECTTKWRNDFEAFGADWIFVGSHRSGRLERFMLGSVSQAVAGRAK